MRKFAIQLVCWLAVTLVGTAILVLTGAEEWLRRMLTDPSATDTGWALSMLVAGILAFVGLLAWIALNAEERIAQFLWPRPRLGSLPFQDTETQFYLEPNGDNRLDIIVNLINEEEDLVRHVALLELTVNGQRHEFGSLDEDGPPKYVNGKRPLSLLGAAHDVPLIPVTDEVARLNVIAKYTVRYAFAERWSNGVRRTTSKTLLFDAPVLLKQDTFDRARTKLFQRFADEKEE